VILSNNLKGTHTTTVVGQFDVDLFLGGTIEIPKQPVLGGVGGNPFIYLQFTDGKGNNLSDEFFLGRCVHGLSVNADLVNKAVALATVQASDCSNHPGPYITLGGQIVLGGLHAKIIFRNNVQGTHTAESVSDVAIIVDGTAIDDPILLGRCVQL